MKKTNQHPFWQFIHKYRAQFILAGILLLAIWFRFYHLNVLPPGLHADEAANGLDIVKRIFHEDLRVIYNTNGPRESLFFFFQAAFVWVFGNTILALRLAPACFGVLAVIFVYLYSKDWFGRRVGLIAALLIAVNPWVITISRDGFRASMVPLVIAMVAFFAGRAYTRQKLWYFIAAAFAFALGFYTYTAFLMFGLVAAAALLYMVVARREWLKANMKNILISVVVFVIAMLPLGYTVVRHPGDSAARAGGTSFLNRDLNGGNPALTLLQSTGKTFLQYNYMGDMNNRHNLSGVPLLNTFVGIMFVLGLLVAFSRFGRIKYAVVLAMFFAMMLPAILTAEGLPHALRSIGTAASVFTLAAIGIDYLLMRWYRTFPLNAPARTFGTATVSVLLALTVVLAYQQYFVAWAQDPQTYDAYNENMVLIADYMNTQTNTNYYLVASSYESMPTEYLTYKKSSYTLLSVDALQSQPLVTDNVEYVFPANNESQKVTTILQAKYPNGQLVAHYSPFDNSLLFYTYKVN